MKTVYRLIVNHSHWLVIMAILAPFCTGGVAWISGGHVAETMAYTTLAIIMAGGVFGLIGLAVCLGALMWVMISLAFGL